LTTSPAEPWVLTWTGAAFEYDNPTEIHVEDIAHHLSHVCRYGGATRFHYSVAQHSLHIAWALWRDHQDPFLSLDGLLHDAAEAYVGDMPSPLKQKFPEFVEYEKRLDAHIRAVLDFDGIPVPLREDPITKHYDMRILLDERSLLLPNARHAWNLPDNLQPLGIEIAPKHPSEVKRAWLDSLTFYSHAVPPSSGGIKRLYGLQ
jgi:hypothetical protein